MYTVDEIVLKRFFNKVNKTDTCWLWTGSLDRGYGNFKYNGRCVRAYRFYYEYLNGNIEDNLVIDHLCRVKNCVNPDHLEAVSQKENVSRGLNGTNHFNSLKRKCLNGHEYSGINKFGRRICKECNLDAVKRYNKRKNK
jgi:hypothetical protein